MDDERTSLLVSSSRGRSNGKAVGIVGNGQNGTDTISETEHEAIGKVESPKSFGELIFIVSKCPHLPYI